MCIRDRAMGMWIGVGEAHQDHDTNEDLISRWSRTFEDRPRVCDIANPLHRGWLLKKATITGRWKPLYFVLSEDGTFIYYYESDKADTRLKGLICLIGAQIELEEPGAKYDLTVTMWTDFPRRPEDNMQSSVYYLRTELEKDYRPWVELFRASKGKVLLQGQDDPVQAALQGTQPEEQQPGIVSEEQEEGEDTVLNSPTSS
eukprot:TRINITY_DN10736_c0_g1_i1.p1 TRINITY_DN10736_c0_g1~~TRINITY_DN10736_c0_g1_i1.p1  ORF type:complete len:201 (-),score=61.17 TRINITY_DN10736_c0_g1_i1:225-827(-)